MFGFLYCHQVFCVPNNCFTSIAKIILNCCPPKPSPKILLYLISSPQNVFIKTSVTSTVLTFFFFPLQLVQEEGGRSLLQSLGHSLHSRERLIQVGEVMRADRTQSCKAELESSHCCFQCSLECCLCSPESLHALL